VHWAPDGKALDWKWRDRVPDAPVLAGVRWARNTVHHQWADALVIAEGFQFPVTFPMAFWEWVWRPIAEFPVADRPDRRGQAVYREALEGMPARTSLAMLDEIFALLAMLLEPTSWRYRQLTGPT
jgi:hypothetical protein